MEQLRSYSSVFSRRAFSDIIEYDDFSKLDILFDRYDSNNKRIETYYEYIKYIYKILVKNYRCEYVYKNEIINELLIKKYGTQSTIAINEFRVQGSIVDIALFNGESKAFEIKTEYDSKRRLDKQLDDYSHFFQKCYIVIPEEQLCLYENDIPSNVGIIVLYLNRGRVNLREVKKAEFNDKINSGVLMRSIKTAEYKNIIKEYYGYLPNVSCFDMFAECEILMAKIPQQELRRLILQEIKKRNSSTGFIKTSPSEIRQICLSLNLNIKQLSELKDKLNSSITPL